MTTFLNNRPHTFQQHFQHSADGPSVIELLLTDTRDIIRAGMELSLILINELTPIS